MKPKIIRFAIIAAFAVGMMLPQPAPASDKPYHLGHISRQARRRGFGYDPDKMMSRLDLNSRQTKQADAILNATRERTEPTRAALHENSTALHTAFRNNNPAEIRMLTNKQNALMNNMVAAYYDAKIKFYRILTPEQRVKADRINAEYRQHIEARTWPHGLRRG